VISLSLNEEITMAWNAGKERIGMNDSVMTAIIKMAGGNPGAITVMADMVRQGGFIDPDDFMGGFGAVLGLDSHGIYEHRIWMLYKDVCNQNLVHMLGLLRACQLGMLSDVKLDKAIDGTEPLSEDQVVGYLVQVQTRLPNFGKDLHEHV
jgi:hypothetical protein